MFHADHGMTKNRCVGFLINAFYAGARWLKDKNNMASIKMLGTLYLMKTMR
jgi:hypothetical protein